jgi:DNA-binding winged helix-turn-helix (wHTH) protein
MENKYIVSVYTEDNFLYQKIKLSLPLGALAIRNGGADVASLTLVDLDTAKAPDGEFMGMSRRGGADIKIPFSIEMAEALFGAKKKNNSAISLDSKSRSVYLHGEKIKLTEIEFSLLSLLFSASGEFVSRDEILRSVWSGECDGGVINVYIHYLRGKLETGGERVIISSRLRGYSINPKFLKGGKDHAEAY